jgi:hypothetical protein
VGGHITYILSCKISAAEEKCKEIMVVQLILVNGGVPSEVLTKLSQIPSSMKNASVTT